MTDSSSCAVGGAALNDCRVLSLRSDQWHWLWVTMAEGVDSPCTARSGVGVRRRGDDEAACTPSGDGEAGRRRVGREIEEETMGLLPSTAALVAAPLLC